MIRKIFFCYFMSVVLTGCTNLEEKDSAKLPKEIVQEKKVEDYVDPYIDDNPINLGVYVYQNGRRNLTKSYDGNFIVGKDIVSFEVYYTTEEILTGNQKKLWNNYYQDYQDINKYKIGYYIYFEVGDEKYEKMILSPSDTSSIFNYVQLYLYDDINQNASWYDHIENDEMMDDTILTSIKLTAGSDIDKITSPINLIAFTYDGDDDFDSNNHYRGNSFFEVVVNRK